MDIEVVAVLRIITARARFGWTIRSFGSTCSKNPASSQFRPNAGEFGSRMMLSPVARIAPRRGGGLVAATAGGFCLLGPEADSRVVADPTSAELREMLNDSKCDPIGRLWCASMDRNLRQPLGRLHRLDPDYRCLEMDQGFITGNGLAFSPDGQRLYLADSRAEIVWVYDYRWRPGSSPKGGLSSPHGR